MALLVAKNEHVGWPVHQGVCDMPTEQNINHKEQDAPISHPQRPHRMPLQHSHNGSHHLATTIKQP